MIKSFFETFVAMVKPPLPGTVGVAFDAVTVGGTTLQSLHGSVRFDGKSWVLRDFAFRAPGFTEVNLSGQLDNGPQGLAFSGPAKLKSADLKMLMAWLEGRSEPPSGRAEDFNRARRRSRSQATASRWIGCRRHLTRRTWKGGSPTPGRRAIGRPRSTANCAPQTSTSMR